MCAVLTIGEFARRSGLSISALRFYDKRGVLEPAAVNAETGYRSYEESQLGDATLVAQLRRLHVPLRSLSEFMSSHPDDRKRIVDEHVEDLARRLNDAAEVARRLAATENEQETNLRLTLDADDLRKGIEQVLPAVGTDPERPVLMSLLIESKHGSVRLVGTDSHRLAVRDMPLPSAPDGFRALVPGASIRRLLPLLSAAGPVQLQLDAGRFEVTTSAGQGGATVLDATYPEYEQLLDAAPTTLSLQTQREDLADAFNAAEAGTAVRLRFTTARLVVSTSDGERELAADYDGEDFECWVNPAYAAAAVRSAVGPDVVLEASAPLYPIVFRSADDGTFVCLVMPVRADAGQQVH